MSIYLLIAVSVIGSLMLTGALRRYAINKDILDHPNDRTSHSIPTPRGGGVAIVITFLVMLLLAWQLSFIDTNLFAALFGAGAIVALIGFIDDHGHVSARWRLLVHFVAAGWLLYWLGGLPAVELAGFSLALGWFGHIVAAVYLVWLLNLYNFMDGIDGIAGLEALTVCLGMALILSFSPATEPAAAVHILMAAAVLGFLFWNFPKARIFMGDAGSGFVGLMLGGLSIYGAWLDSQLIWAWLILLGVFVVDATVTLVRRVLRGDKFYKPHRSHAYQYASRKCGSHIPVTLGVGVINLFWLLPLAVAVSQGLVEGLWGLLLAYAPLLMAAAYYRAGAADLQD